jgi:hypothetical protein
MRNISGLRSLVKRIKVSAVWRHRDAAPCPFRGCGPWSKNVLHFARSAYARFLVFSARTALTLKVRKGSI